MLPGLYFLDLLGVLAFAFFGSYVSLKKGCDLFGIFVCALLSGLGGGAIREVTLGKIPVYLNDNNYLYAVVVGMLLAIVIYKHFEKIQKYFLFIDAIGLTAFAFIGAERAASFHLSNVAIVFFAVITAVGGGIMRDIALKEIPYIFQKDFYATPAIILGILYVILKSSIGNYINAYLLIIAIFILRATAIRYRYQLWPNKK